MTGYYWIAGAVGIVTTLVCLSGLCVGGAMLFRYERRAGALLFAAAGLFLTRAIASTVLNVLLFSRMGVEAALPITWGVDGALAVAAWLMIAGALVLLARTLRDVPRVAPTPGLPAIGAAGQRSPPHL